MTSSIPQDPVDQQNQNTAQDQNDTLIGKENDFIHTIAHRLRSPLTAIRGASEVIQSSDIQTLPKEDLTKLLYIIRDQSAEALNRLLYVVDALDLASGKLILQKSNEDLKKILDECVHNFSEKALRKRVKLTAEINDLPNISSDKQRIAEAIESLLTNSLKASQEAGEIKITANVIGNKIAIMISDNGKGMPQEELQTIFAKPFAKNEDRGKKEESFGLYLVKGIIEGHGGTIALTSQENQGTTATITLPLTA